MEEIFNKPKYIVRYQSGGCGHFFTLLLMSFVAPIPTTELFSGHGDDHDVFVGQYHNFLSHYKTLKTTTEHYTDDNANVQYIKQWQDTYKFFPSPWPYYCVHTHLIRTDLWSRAWPNTKLIKIRSQYHQQDQVAYNWMLKNRHKQFYSSYIEKYLKMIKYHYNITPKLDLADERAQCWIIRYASRPYWNQFNTWLIDDEIQVEFHQLFQGSLNLPALCTDLGIDCDSQGMARASELLQNYVRAQRPVPWLLNLEDYQ